MNKMNNQPPTNLTLNRELKSNYIRNIDDVIKSIPKSDVQLNVEEFLNPLVYFIYSEQTSEEKRITLHYISIITTIYTSAKRSFLFCSEICGCPYNLSSFLEFRSLDDAAKHDKKRMDNLSEAFTKYFLMDYAKCIMNRFGITDLRAPIAEYHQHKLIHDNAGKCVSIKNDFDFEVASQIAHYAYFLMKTSQGVRPTIVFQDINLGMNAEDLSTQRNQIIHEYVRQYYMQPWVQELVQKTFDKDASSFQGIKGIWNNVFYSNRTKISII